MTVFTHLLVFLLGLAISALTRYGLSCGQGRIGAEYFVSATLTFVGHKGIKITRSYAGSFRTEKRDPNKMAQEFKNALLGLTTQEMPEEIFQLTDKENYHIQIHSMNKV